MKVTRTPITAAKHDLEKDFNGAFDDISYKAYKVDYEMDVNDDIEMTLTCKKDKQFMPEIEVETVQEDGIYYFQASMIFPELKYDDMDYSDSFHYWVATMWEPITRLVENINRFSYDPAAPAPEE